MKKVWILEKFETREEMLKYLEDYKNFLEKAKANHDEEEIKCWERVVTKYGEFVESTIEGRWIGFDGKTVYRTFCDVAKASIRRNPNAKFRVVEGEIEDDAKSWVGYKIVKENEGVLRYLMATK